MSINPFKLALIQMKVIGGDKTTNLQHACELITQAADNGANVMLLPECFDVGWLSDAAHSEAEPIPDGLVCRMLMKSAQEQGVDICAGITERAGDLIYNSAIYIDSSGTVSRQHRKINELDIGQSCYAQGNCLSVISTTYGHIGLMICADGFAQHQVLSRSLCEMGADVILSPCAWAVPADHNPITEPYGDLWRENYIPVAQEYSIWIAGVSNVGVINSGPWSGRHCIGCSLVIDPHGKEILQGPYGKDAETILYVDMA